jgi:hypothetical protein
MQNREENRKDDRHYGNKEQGVKMKDFRNREKKDKRKNRKYE